VLRVLLLGHSYAEVLTNFPMLSFALTEVAFALVDVVSDGRFLRLREGAGDNLLCGKSGLNLVVWVCFCVYGGRAKSTGGNWGTSPLDMAHRSGSNGIDRQATRDCWQAGRDAQTERCARL
jgi:hypothetical protein